MTTAKLKIKKGDTVVVLTGKDKGKQGEILSVLPKTRVVVKGVNLVKNTKARRQHLLAGLSLKEHSIHVSNVALLDPKSGKPTRVGYKTDAKGGKTRIAKKSGEKIG